MKKINCILLLTVVYILISCDGGRNMSSNKSSGIISLPKHGDGKSTYFAHFDATKRATTIQVTEGGIKILAEAPPDAAVNLAKQMNANASVDMKDIDVKAQVAMMMSSNKTIQEIGKKTVAVNILRDYLYRLNEFNFNNSGCPMDTYTFVLYKEILATVTEITEIEKSIVAVDSIKAQVELERSKATFIESYMKMDDNAKKLFLE